LNTQTLPSDKISPAQFSEDRKINVVLKSVVHDIQGYASHLEQQIQELSSIGKALSSVNDLGELLGTIVDKARAFTHADAGTLYLKEGNALKFSIFQNDTLKIRLGGKNQGAITYPPIALDDSSISSYVALNGKTVNIPDVYVSKLADFTGPKKFDLATGYRTQSMLVVLLKNHENDTIGVLQLINSKDPKTGETVPFSHHAEHLTESLASQAAVAISNVSLIRDMENLFEAFVKVMATAIDEKSPVTGGHIRRVANLTLTMAAVVHHQNNGAFKNTFFSKDQMHELRIASWMHDIGKVTTPVEIIEKATKLQTIFDRVHHIRLRMDYLIQKTKNEGLEQKIELMRSHGSQDKLDRVERQTMAKLRELAEIRSFITQCNEPKEYLEDSRVERLMG